MASSSRASPWRGAHWATAVLFLLVSMLSPAWAEPCADKPKDVTVVQFTETDCSCCFDLDDFIQDNDYVYVLFYSPQGRLNQDIGSKFEELASDWKHSRIHFGKIDTDKDRLMAQKWVEPHMVPTNVMYKFGRPVEVQPADFEKIRDKYHGNPDGQKWLLTKYLGDDVEGSNLHYAKPISNVKKLQKFVKKHEIAIIGFFKKEKEAAYKVFSETIWSLHQEIDQEDIGAAVGVTISQTLAKKEKAQTPTVVVYLDGKVVEEEGTYTGKWVKPKLLEFLKQFLPLDDNAPEKEAGVEDDEWKEKEKEEL